MKTFLIDEELRDKLVFYEKNFREPGTGMLSGLRLDAVYRRNLLDAEKELANLPEANMLDLGGLERFGLVEDSTWYNCLQAKEDGDYVRYSDLTNALLTEKRPATKTELYLAVHEKLTHNPEPSLETLQLMARDLGIETEVEVSK